MADDEEETPPPPYEYTGQRLDGVGNAEMGPRHGKGKASFSNGDTYIGQYYNGMRHGRGEYTWAGPKDPEKFPNGKWLVDPEPPAKPYRVRYTGMYANNQKGGYGVMSYPDKSRYEGIWKEDKRHGQGTYYFPNGDIYTGEWAAGKKHGKGTYIFTSAGCQYVGEWKEGRIVSGQWINREYSKYIGMFDEQSKPTGHGTFWFQNGNKQEGQYLKRDIPEAEPDEDDKIPQETYWKGGEVEKLATAPKESEFMVY